MFLPLVVGSLLLGGGHAQAPHKRALLIEVSDYAPQFEHLSSTANIQKLEPALDAWGFKDRMVVDEPLRTKKNGILAAMQSFADTCHKGDIVFVHVACHGVNVPDQTGGPSHADGLEHCIAPSDTVRLPPAPGKTEGDIDPKTVILGSEVGKWLQSLRDKGVDQLLITLDMCHASGSARGLPEGITHSIHNPAADDAPVKTTAASSPRLFDLKGYVALYASRNTEKAWEERQSPGGGRFTTALAYALSNDPQRENYEQLLDQINGYLHDSATPQTAEIESGERLDRPIFGGEAPSSGRRYYSVSARPGEGVVLQAGSIQGLTKNSVVGIVETRPSGPNAPLKPIGLLRTVNVGKLESTLLPLDSASKADSDARSKAEGHSVWGYIVKIGPGDYSIDVLPYKLDPKGMEMWNQLKSSLPILKEVKEGEPFDLMIRREAGDGQALSSAGANYVVSTYEQLDVDKVPTSDPYASDRLMGVVQQVMQWKGLGKIPDHPQPEYSVDVELYRVVTKMANDPDSNRPVPVFASLGNELKNGESLRSGESFAVRVKCDAPKDLDLKGPYINAVALQPNITVAAQYPLTAQIQHDENRLPMDGKWHWLKNPAGFVDDNPNEDVIVYQVTDDPSQEGVGAEYFKLFASQNQLPLRKLTSRGTRDVSDQPTDPLARFLDGTYTGTRALDPPFEGHWVLKTITYHVVH